MTNIFTNTFPDDWRWAPDWRLMGGAFLKYLAARHLVDEQPPDTLRAAVDDVTWRETLLFDADLVDDNPDRLVGSALRSGSPVALSFAFAVAAGGGHPDGGAPERAERRPRGGQAAGGATKPAGRGRDVLIGRNLPDRARPGAGNAPRPRKSVSV